MTRSFRPLALPAIWMLSLSLAACGGGGSSTGPGAAAAPPTSSQGSVNPVEANAPAVTGEDGRAAIEMVEAADRAAVTGETVRLPLAQA